MGAETAIATEVSPISTTPIRCVIAMRVISHRLPGLIGELANLRQRHRLVGLVFQTQHLASDVVLAGGADEGTDRAGQRIGDRGFQSGDIDAIANNPDGTDPDDASEPPLTGGMNAISSPGRGR